MEKVKLQSLPSGRDGNAYITTNGRIVQGCVITKIDGSIESKKDNRQFLGTRVEQNAVRGIKISGNVSYAHATSALIEAIRNYKDGGDYPDITIQYYTETTERGRCEVVLTGVILDNIGLGMLDDSSDTAMIIDTAFTANDFDIISKFKE